MTVLNVISMAGGLGLFLYGMSIMGSGLEKLAGGKTEAILQKLTSSIWKGVVLGALITALMPSRLARRRLWLRPAHAASTPRASRRHPSSRAVRRGNGQTPAGSAG